MTENQERNSLFEDLPFQKKPTDNMENVLDARNVCGSALTMAVMACSIRKYTESSIHVL